ncbi:hypothetical protein IQ266_18965 [filamentous cyanobacterium LEGE 11480]|uniref:VRR-NUC domain-containing protein n=1 Tax=Romeriopsis navalis LEGE 11480 TaxID=2777977 RepID=A0A928Z616_9CYAN|nr:hypothetical protein [Romeriopsis navalis]MBE9031820.1 hypothetical protein [Romeriopsis navalis LEGE 11480]
MRRAARIDANQPEIVDTLRRHGATVQPLHTVGGGCPDLLVGYRGKNFLLEVKDGLKCPSDRKLTPAQTAWHEAWAGEAVVVLSAGDALRVLGIEEVAA